MNILLCGQWDDAERDAWATALRASLLPRDQLVLQRDATMDALIDVAVVANPAPGALAGLPGLRLIQSLWAGVDRLLADNSLPHGVPLARMVDPAMNAAMAETALWAVLSLQRGFFDYAQQQRDGVWRALSQRRADETPVLLLGAGQMGQAAARRIAAAGFAVTVWRSAAGSWSEPGIRVVHGEAALRSAAAPARVVINLLPLTAATRGLLGSALFSMLRRGASIVNLARGTHLVERDLLEALASGQIDRAVLDVFATEPLPSTHAFWTHPRITVLPHVAALTDLRSAAAVVRRNLDALQRGAALAHLVDRRRGY